jgi:uncharacterized protein (DUF1778 family)
LSERLAIPRRRLVNFRLTEGEYDQLRTASAAHGRGISEFARNTILDALNPSGPACLTEQSLISRLNDRLTTFDEAMHRLMKALDSTTTVASQYISSSERNSEK